MADLDRLNGATLVVDLDVSGLKPGTTDVPVTIDLPPGLTLVSASPPKVAVTVTAPPPSPSAFGVPVASLGRAVGIPERLRRPWRASSAPTASAVSRMST